MSRCYTWFVRALNWRKDSVGLIVFLTRDIWQSDSRLRISDSSWVYLLLHHASTAVHRRSGWLHRRKSGWHTVHAHVMLLILLYCHVKF